MFGHLQHNCNINVNGVSLKAWTGMELAQLCWKLSQLHNTEISVFIKLVSALYSQTILFSGGAKLIWKLLCHWLKDSWQCQFVLVKHGPDVFISHLYVDCQYMAYEPPCEKKLYIKWWLICIWKHVDFRCSNCIKTIWYRLMNVQKAIRYPSIDKHQKQLVICWWICRKSDSLSMYWYAQKSLSHPFMNMHTNNSLPVGEYVVLAALAWLAVFIV